MKMTTLTFGIVLAISQLAMANQEIQGKWKYLKTECTSGAVHNKNTEDLITKYDMIADISEENINFKVDFSFQATKAAAKKYAKMINEAEVAIQALQDGAEKAKLLASLNKSKADIQKLVKDGISCSNLAKSSYAIRGNTMYTNLISNASTCASNITQEAETTVSTFEVRNDQLRLTNKVSANSNACPKGDSEVLILEKLN